MCVVKYNKFYNAYDILLSLQENFNDIRIFFDTGASNLTKNILKD